ncbi:MAG: hypothetical protein PVF89_08585, partial [Lysobacterales bacterium]
MKLPPTCPTPALFEAALESTTRLLAGTSRVEPVFPLPHEVPEPLVPAAPAPADYAVLRGRCDALAMRARFHDETLHRMTRPAGPVSAALFEQLEDIRIERCAARWRRGVGVNLAALFDHVRGVRGNNILGTDAPAALPNAVVFAVRARLLNETPAEEAERLVARWEDEIERRCGPLLASLAANSRDQHAFGRDALELIENLELHDDPQRGSQAREAEVAPAEEKLENGREMAAGESGTGDGDGPERAGGDAEEVADGSADGTAGRGGADPGAGAAIVPFPRDGHEGPDRADGEVSDGDPEPPADHRSAGQAAAYRAWTTRFDETVHARDLLDGLQLEALRGQLEQELAKHRRSAVKLASRLQNSLKTLQKRSWTFDLDDGLLDTTRLARLVADPLSPLVYKQERDSASRDTVVSFLVDNSGSMRGRPIALAAMFVDILCHALERCQVATEILGFTTRQWRGGQTRQHWRESGKPPAPGRLSDLRHVIYKSADEPWRRARQTLGGMLWPQL